jgi:mannose-1-phosphate guanylyltransferase
LSRASNPKFLHPLTGTRNSLLEATFARLEPLATADRVYVVTGSAHSAGVARQLPSLPVENILVEPSARDSCPAIALAAAVIAQRDPDAIMASFAADHLIRDTAVFDRVVAKAVEGAEQGYLMTIGITPTRPETGYGYLRCSEPVENDRLQRVLEFKEKPSLDVATRYVDSGKYLWNASMFVWRVSRFLDELTARRPDVAAPVLEIAASWDTEDRDEVLQRLWPTIPKVAVEYAVMEPAAEDGLVATVPGDFGWSDIGDFETLAEVLGTEVTDSVISIAVAGGAEAGHDRQIVSVDSSDVVVLPSRGRAVALVGVRDLIVVDTEDAVLVCKRDRVQDIKKVISGLRENDAERFI